MNIEFNGTVKDEKKYKKLLEIQNAATKLKDQESPTFKCNLKFDEPDNTRPNCLVSVNMEGSFVLLNNPALRAAVAEMIMLADDVAISRPVGQTGIRFAFGVRDIWREE